jgi:two-component system chemotaxis response regulator CheB
MIKVMIVDDSSVMRSLLREVLSEDPEIELVAQAINGRLAIPRIKYYKPDVIILDYEMPEMDGIETLEEIQSIDSSIRVIMYSSYTVEGAAVTIEALSKGACDFLPKPGFDKSVTSSEYLKTKLIPKIKGLCHVRSKADDLIEKPVRKQINKTKFTLCAIGISTGGPQALRDLIPKISKSISGSILITIHMPPVFTEQLAKKIDSESELTVVEAKNSMRIEPGTVYISPGGIHMGVKNVSGIKKIILYDTEPVNHCKPSVDVMFDSLLGLHPKSTVAILMTGMGSDGYESIKKLQKEGSYLITQDRDECLVFGMPSKAIADGIVDEELKITDMAKRISELLE